MCFCEVERSFPTVRKATMLIGNVPVPNILETGYSRRRIFSDPDILQDDTLSNSIAKRLNDNRLQLRRNPRSRKTHSLYFLSEFTTNRNLNNGGLQASATGFT